MSFAERSDDFSLIQDLKILSQRHQEIPPIQTQTQQMRAKLVRELPSGPDNNVRSSLKRFMESDIDFDESPSQPDKDEREFSFPQYSCGSQSGSPVAPKKIHRIKAVGKTNKVAPVQK